MSLNKLDKMHLLDANVVKITVVTEFEKNPQLKEFNQKIPLTNIIQDLCSGWDLIDPELYALKFSETTNQNYVTEKNRNEIINVSILRLAFSPTKIAHDILQTLHSQDCLYYWGLFGVYLSAIWCRIRFLICSLFLINMPIENLVSPGNDDRNERMSALQKLSECSTDTTFALEFINKHGLPIIISLIERGKCQGAMLTYALASFVELMDHGIVSWDILETPFIKMVASYVNNQTSTPQEAKVVKSSLSILESIVLNSSAKYGQVEKEVGIPNLVLQLENKNPIIQQNALSLMYALFLKAGPSKRKMIASTLCNLQVRGVILQNIHVSSGEVKFEMAHQIYVMEAFLLSERMNTKIDLQDEDTHEKIKELRLKPFEFDFLIGDELTETPPGIGMLTLDCMVFFVRKYSAFYFEITSHHIFLEDKRKCPFVRSSVELVRFLFNILKIGELPSEQTNKSYYQIFCNHDNPFHELYCICILLLNNIWTEKHATSEDFVNILSDVREYTTRALASKPANLKKLELKQYTFQWEKKVGPISQLKEMITPSTLKYIKQQRLDYMVDGTRFTKYSQHGQRVKDKFWFVRLSHNHKVLHYGDCDDKSVPTIEQLPNKLRIVDIKALLTGKDCTHIKDAKNRKSTHQLAFSLTSNSVEKTPLYFVAPDQMVYDYWIDGINALLGNKMTSKEADNDLEISLSLGINLRQMGYGVEIDFPQNPPKDWLRKLYFKWFLMEFEEDDI